ncbi:MAG: archaeoflavoprotein AfpA [Candidatus Bathyarchaeota archaeon]
MTSKIVWGITGSGDLLPETLEVMSKMTKSKEVEITIVLSEAAVKVLKWYKIFEKLNNISNKVLVEEDANTPFIVGLLQTGKFDCMLVAPATGNSVAKIVRGIADTIITNAVAQANKANVDIYILPVDQKEGTTTTILPNGKKLELTIRNVDAGNVNKLRGMKGIHVLEKPGEIETIFDNI